MIRGTDISPSSPKGPESSATGIKFQTVAYAV